jgi:hypothetical protein
MKSARAAAKEDLDKGMGVFCRRSGKATICGDSKNHVQIHVGVDVRSAHHVAADGCVL